MHDAVPDMVTVGKPIANGYPLSALVTTEKIATAFCKGKRTYFNTYGGAPVGMAAGLATLEVIENEKLQDNAKITGRYLKEQLLKLKSRHWMMADVRGSGLFVGFELSKCSKHGFLLISICFFNSLLIDKSKQRSDQNSLPIIEKSSLFQNQFKLGKGKSD